MISACWRLRDRLISGKRSYRAEDRLIRNGSTYLRDRHESTYVKAYGGAYSADCCLERGQDCHAFLHCTVLNPSGG